MGGEEKRGDKFILSSRHPCLYSPPILSKEY